MSAQAKHNSPFFAVPRHTCRSEGREGQFVFSCTRPHSLFFVAESGKSRKGRTGWIRLVLVALNGHDGSDWSEVTA